VVNVAEVWLASPFFHVTSACLLKEPLRRHNSSRAARLPNRTMKSNSTLTETMSSSTIGASAPLVEQYSVPRAKVLTSELEKPSLDDRAYRVIQLPNKLEALLVHDADTDKASAAMDVCVGSYSDRDDMLGMAHAVEHLLLMGTEKVGWSRCGGISSPHASRFLSRSCETQLIGNSNSTQKRMTIYNISTLILGGRTPIRRQHRPISISRSLLRLTLKYLPPQIPIVILRGSLSSHPFTVPLTVSPNSS
jgi:hypothetical protein